MQQSTSSRILTKHATHGPGSNYYKRATVNDRKRKSSCIHVLCDDLVLFRLRSKEFSPVCTGTAFLFVDCHRSENQFQENLNRSNRTKIAKT